jgi:hypothetical protein
MVASCVICLGESGQALAGKRCRASSCKKAYAERLAALKAARTGHLVTPVARGASPAPSTDGTTSTDSAPDFDSLSQFKLWELLAVYGRRDYDPDQLSPYELRNGVSAGNVLAALALTLASDSLALVLASRARARLGCLALALASPSHRPSFPDPVLPRFVLTDREKERALLCFAHFKEDVTDAGRSRHGWIKLDVIVRALGDNELNVLDHFEENNPNKEWTEARAALRELHPCDDDE